ncbi:MAG: PAS domain-containing protein [Terriglobales bacterium]
MRSPNSALSAEDISHVDLAADTKLIRAALLMLLAVTTALGGVTWNSVQDLSVHVQAIPVFLFVVVCIIVVRMYVRAGEIAKVCGRAFQLDGEALASDKAERLLETIKASRESFRDLIDSFGVAVFTLSLDGKIRTANKRFREILERPFPQLIGSSIFDVIAGPSAEALKAALPRFLETRHWSGVVPVCVAATGQWHYFQCTLQPVLQDGEVVSITVIADDVTVARERETLFANLFETLHEPIWVARPDGRFLDLNQSMSALIGNGEKQPLLDSSLLDIVLEPEQSILRDVMRRHEPVQDLELTVVRQDGSRAACIASATPVIDVSGSARYYGTFTDISRRREMERRLAGEQQLREQMIACLPDALVTLDRQGRFTFLSSRGQALFGRAAEPLLNTLAADCFDPQDLLAWQTLLQDSLSRAGSVFTRELHVRRGDDGAWRTVLVHATALQNQEQQIEGVIASLRDVTDERLMEQQLIAGERMVAVGRMIEGFSYELNNPLTAILGACELLKEANLPASVDPKLELLDSQTRRACEIVQNLLLFSPAADAMASLNLAELIHRTVALRRHSLRASRVSVSVVGGEDIPNIIGNRAQLMQVFMNLLVHAQQACTSGGRDHGAIRICIGYSEKTVWCTFQDDGCGIPAEDRERIFEPFFASKHGAAGLGLSICRSIIGSHGGSISACPAPDGGSIFCVTLPAISSDASVPSSN